MRFTHHSQITKGMRVYIAKLESQNQAYVPNIYCYYLISDPVLLGPAQGTPSYFVDGRTEGIDLNAPECSIILDVGTGLWNGNAICHPPMYKTISLMDAGVGQTPQYNEHAIFDNLKEAKLYVEGKMGGHGLINNMGVSSTSPGTPAPVFDIHPSLDEDYDRAMRGI